jgi:hypothetical protein
MNSERTYAELRLLPVRDEVCQLLAECVLSVSSSSIFAQEGATHARS